MAIGPGAMASNMKSAHEWPKFPPLMSQIIGIIGAGSVISGLLLANDMHMRAAIAGCAGSGNSYVCWIFWPNGFGSDLVPMRPRFESRPTRVGGLGALVG